MARPRRSHAVATIDPIRQPCRRQVKTIAPAVASYVPCRVTGSATGRNVETHDGDPTWSSAPSCAPLNAHCVAATRRIIELPRVASDGDATASAATPVDATADDATAEAPEPKTDCSA